MHAYINCTTPLSTAKDTFYNNLVMDELFAEIEKHLASDPNPFAIFDFDNTVIENDIGEIAFAYLCRNGLLKDSMLLGESVPGNDYHERVFKTYHERVRNGQYRDACELAARAFSGFTPDEASAVARTALKAEGSNLYEETLYEEHILRGIKTHSQTLELMRFLKERSVIIWIISASAEVAVKAAIEHFNIQENLIGVRLMPKDGMYTSEFEIPTPIREGKVECMRTHIDPKQAPLLVIDDSPNGLPILETATIKVAVDRGNELTRIARECGWAVI